ncbi:unnamed protein product [Urochloa humidicola]
MPKLEHAKLLLSVHKKGCLNGASSLGIDHLSSLSKVEVEICGSHLSDNNYDPTKDFKDSAVRWVASAINGAIVTHRNCPTIRFETKYDYKCDHFEHVLRKVNQRYWGSLTGWLKIWQIEEEKIDQEQIDGLNY